MQRKFLRMGTFAVLPQNNNYIYIRPFPLPNGMLNNHAKTCVNTAMTMHYLTGCIRNLNKTRMSCFSWCFNFSQW